MSRIILRTLILLVALSLSACVGHQQLYTEVSLGYVINDHTPKDHYGDYDCRMPFYVAIGTDFPNAFSMAVTHRSHLDCGFPAGKRFDISTEELTITKRFDLNHFLNLVLPD